MNRSLHAEIDSSAARIHTVAASPTSPPPSLRGGGVAALVQAATFVFGFIIYVTVVAGGDYANPAVDAAEHVAFLADNQLVLHVWYAIIYLVFGSALMVLAPAVYDRVRTGAPVLARAATGFGLIWATLMFAVGMSAIVGGELVLTLNAIDPSQAASLWTSVNLLVEGMGGGIELVGGLWIGLISAAALRARVLTTWLNRIGVLTGVAGVASIAMLASEAVTSVFGLGSIVWFTWLGLHLVRAARRKTAVVTLSASPASPNATASTWPSMTYRSTSPQGRSPASAVQPGSAIHHTAAMVGLTRPNTCFEPSRSVSRWPGTIVIAVGDTSGCLPPMSQARNGLAPGRPRLAFPDHDRRTTAVARAGPRRIRTYRPATSRPLGSPSESPSDFRSPAVRTRRRQQRR